MAKTNQFFFALRQTKEQTILDFAGTIKQHQGKAEVGAGTVLAIFLEGLKGSIAKQVAIQDPKTFDKAVAIVTRLESLDKTKPGKVTLNLMGEESETDPLEGAAGIVDRLGMVLARIEAVLGIKTRTARRNKIGRGRTDICMLREIRRVVNKRVKPVIPPKQWIRPSEVLRRVLIKTKRKGRCLKRLPVTLRGSVSRIRTMAMPQTTVLG